MNQGRFSDTLQMYFDILIFLLNRRLFAIIPLRGRVAQLGEHLARIQEVRGSNPLTSTRLGFSGIA